MAVTTMKSKISENDYWDTLKNTIKESAYPAGVPNEIV